MQSSYGIIICKLNIVGNVRRFGDTCKHSYLPHKIIY